MLDYLHFLRAYPRYQELFWEGDPQKLANKFQTSGYATDSAYSEKLITRVNQHNLTRYDRAPITAPIVAGSLLLLAIIAFLFLRQ